MEGLVRCSLLCARTVVEEWLLLGKEDVPSSPDGYVVSFVHFHERGFTTPAHKFLRGLLHYYKIELQHLNPNGIQHMAAFIALCVGTGDQPPLQSMEVLLCHHPLEEEGEQW